MAKINLTVPDYLKDEMGGFDNINWSRIASDAFAKAIKKEKIMQLDMDNMDNVVERFKAQIAQEDERYGTAGTEWAKNSATIDEMRWLSRCEEEAYPDAMDEIAKNYRAEHASFFWMDLMKEDFNVQPSNEAKTVFAQAAMAVWSEVKQFL